MYWFWLFLLVDSSGDGFISLFWGCKMYRYSIQLYLSNLLMEALGLCFDSLEHLYYDFLSLCLSSSQSHFWLCVCRSLSCLPIHFTKHLSYFQKRCVHFACLFNLLVVLKQKPGDSVGILPADLPLFWRRSQ